ncbi:MAG TPA: hypothetical protein VIO38_07325 [Rariglobus sp.]
MKSPLLLLFLTALCVTAGHADPLALRFLNWEGAEDSLKFASKGRTVSLRADESTLSPVYSYDGPSPLVLFKQVLVEGKTVRQPVASLNVPEGLTHAIVVLIPNAADGTCSGVWIDDSPKSRPAGTLRLVNLSNRQVLSKIGAAEFSLAPTESHQMTIGAEATQIMAQAAAQVGGKWEVIANNPLPVRPRLRLLIVLRNGRPLPGARPNAVDLLSFYDRPPPLPASEGPALDH